MQQFSFRRKKEGITRKEVNIIKEYLKARRKQQRDNTRKLDSLNEQRKNRLIDKLTYDRSQELLLCSNEIERIEMLDSLMLYLKK
jgi:hypothetical protein